MGSAASIIHADLDAFYASVEQRDDPALRHRPVIVGGGVVLAASYEARARGVRTAMGGARARSLCPDAVVIAPRFSAYAAASRAVFEVFRATTPLVEPLSIDEAFLDVRGLRAIAGSPLAIASELRRAVGELVGLPITVGLASSKFVAKVASGVGKPDGLLVVPAGAEAAFLGPLPVRRLWGVGAASGARLAAHGITSVAQVAALPEAELVAILGRGAGRHVHRLARGLDRRSVRPRAGRRSIGAQRALGRSRTPRSAGELDAALMGLVDRVARRLRAAGRACRTVVLRLRFDDYARATRSRTLVEATERTAPLLGLARELLDGCAALILRRGLTLLGVTLTGLCAARAEQLALPLVGPQPRGHPRSMDHLTRLDRAVDTLRDRFGSDVISRGRLLGAASAPELDSP